METPEKDYVYTVDDIKIVTESTLWWKYSLFFFFTQIKAFLQPPMEGIVLETYGSGNAPDCRIDLLQELQAATERGLIIINCTQCLRGSVTVSYATGKVGSFSNMSVAVNRLLFLP